MCCWVTTDLLRFKSIGKIIDGPYALNIDHSQENALVTTSHTEAEELWQIRFGHVHNQSLKHMASRGTVAGMYFNESAQVNEDCVLGLNGRHPLFTLHSRTWK